MQQTITASHSVTVQYLSQLPALNENFVNLMIINYWCRLKIKFDLLVTYYRIHKKPLLLLRIFAFLTSFTEPELMNVQVNYWWGQMRCAPNQIFRGGGMAHVAPTAAPLVTLNNLNGVMTADPHYLCGSWASCCYTDWTITNYIMLLVIVGILLDSFITRAGKIRREQFRCMLHMMQWLFVKDCVASEFHVITNLCFMFMS